MALQAWQQDTQPKAKLEEGGRPICLKLGVGVASFLKERKEAVDLPARIPIFSGLGVCHAILT